MTHQHPMREGDRFAVETFSCAKELSTYQFSNVDYRVVYADNCETSHCIWMVPGTFEHCTDATRRGQGPAQPHHADTAQHGD